MQTPYPQAPALHIEQWLNTEHPLSLASLRGRVVALHAFQMLCPACVSHGLPQAGKIRRLFAPDDVAVLGLHSVFEHHSVMTAAALRAFVSEYRLDFPIGIDRPAASGPVPTTMRDYRLRGTPSVVLIDRQGRIRMNHFGVIDDMALGAAIGQLVAEPVLAVSTASSNPDPSTRPTQDGQCSPDGCALP
ncbi:redoxin family protein [Pseudomonas sp. CGJS7]|uniref:redoxin family protein n=1 Tax=Pseudomonas sp. CGJS7 TaxID=3109348 RepID=UPI00300A5423